MGCDAMRCWTFVAIGGGKVGLHAYRCRFIHTYIHTYIHIVRSMEFEGSM